MNFAGTTRKWCNFGLLAMALLAGGESLRAQNTGASSARPTNPPVILSVEGTNVLVQRFPSNVWQSAYVNQILAPKDRGRTGIRSRTSIRLSDLSILRIGERSEFEIQPLPDPKVEAEFSLFRGLMYLLNRDRPGKHRFVTPTATAATRGTEFTLEVDETTGRTVLTVLEGEAELGNDLGSVRIRSGEQGVAILGQIPTRTAVIDTTNVVQWCLYYPGVLDPADLQLPSEIRAAIQSSLDAYASGDLLRAVAAYPAERVPGDDDEKLYLAALLLSVGQVAQADTMLDSFAPRARSNGSRLHRLAGALRVVIGAVIGRSGDPPASVGWSPQLATEQLAWSYAAQSRGALDEALREAESSVRTSPQFAFGWARVAELEFGQGRPQRALNALDKSLALAPRNAQAVALKGFLLAARNEIAAATEAFERALGIDGGLGNAWLGRGLCRIREGRAVEGRLDLQIAATTEPRRSLLRSYLGKAFSNAGDHRHADKELRLAQELDAGDPTPWLYSALLLQQHNRINEGVRDLQRSQELNDNRAVYRGNLLLDQDRAVRGANLAGLYRDAGMKEVSAREAGRAVNADYANYSAHRFLANSFNELRDPKAINQRYESAWFTEYLLANLLSPVGAGGLSQTVSQQEYSRLFEKDGFGLASATAWFSHGEWVQSAVQYGTVDNLGYAAEIGYHSDNGWRPNNDFSRFAATVTLKYDLTSQDSLYVQGIYFNGDSGDLTQYYRQSDANTRRRIEEFQEPLLIAGYRHEWSPGNHTLLLATRLQASTRVDDPAQRLLWFDRSFSGNINEVAPLQYEQELRQTVESYSAELQQILQRRAHTFAAGARVQAGEIDTRNIQPRGLVNTALLGVQPVPFLIRQNIESGFNRVTAYLYDHWQVWETLLLAGGFSYDRITRPDNYRLAPIDDEEDSRDQLSPKAGLIWTPARHTTLRAAYYRTLGGVSLDQSVRIEPSQVAGFNQAYRSLIPESVAGSNDGAETDGWALSLERRFGKGTFAAISGEILSSRVERQLGVVSFVFPVLPVFATEQTRETLDYRERNLSFTLNQLVGDEWAFGARYRISKAELEERFTEIPAGANLIGGFQRATDVEAVLHQVDLSALYNHASGFFAGANALWNRQSNQGYSLDRPGDDFWQFNVEAGWRFFRRRLEARAAVLNLADRNYRLNPLSLATELPRERTLALTLRFNF